MASSSLSKNISGNRAVFNEFTTTHVDNNLVLTYNFPRDTIIDTATSYDKFVDYNSHYTTRNINNPSDNLITTWEIRINNNNLVSGKFSVLDTKNPLDFIISEMLYIDSEQNPENGEIVASIRVFNVIISSGRFKDLKFIKIDFNNPDRIMTFY
jgi:hypothetical protein